MVPMALPSDAENSHMRNSDRPSQPTSRRGVEIIEIDSDDEDVLQDEGELDSADYDEEIEGEEGWDEEGDEDEDASMEDDDEANGYERGSAEEEEDDYGPDILTISSDPAAQSPIDVQEALHPLRNTADRVFTQIEAFAQNLDRFRRQSRGAHDPETYREACTLVKKYHKIAQDSVAELSKSRRGKASTFSFSHNAAKENVADDANLRKWELEAETWELFLQILSMEDPESQQRSKQAQETVLQKLHRYSSDREVWEGFLEADHFSREGVAVLKWLERSARKDTMLIDGQISDLETDADRGQGLWAHGWLYTKEAIKGAKRLRSWPQHLDPDDPGIIASLVSSDTKQPLITQLDPDAVTRQRLGLQRQDDSFEQATWLTCWKMLREGRPWSQIREWSHERLESWRAVSICGSCLDSGSTAGKSQDHDCVRMMNFRSQTSWRSACSNLANNSKAGKYERGVYALLAGELEAALDVCQGWNDHLYVWYNHMILTRYGDFCKRFQRKLSYAPGTKQNLTVDPAPHEALRGFVSKLLNNPQLSAESKNPFRIIQATILSRNYYPFFFHQGDAVCKVAADDPSSLVATSRVGEIVTIPDDAALIAARDEFAVRITAHFFNMIGYLDFLKKSNKLELIPLYSKTLHPDTTIAVLANVLLDVVRPSARQQQVKLLKSLGIDLAAVLKCQYYSLLEEASKSDNFRKPLKLTHAIAKDANGAQTIKGVKTDLIGRRLRSLDEKMIRCMQWHCLLGDRLQTIRSRGLALFKRFLFTGRPAAAREFWTRVRLSEFLEQSGAYDEFEEELEEEDRNLREDDRIRCQSKPDKDATQAEHRPPSSEDNRQLSNFLQLQTIRDLEFLMAAFDAVEHWCNAFNEVQRNPELQTREVKKELEQKLDDVGDMLLPICGDWLKLGRDKIENEEYKWIRASYIPELLFAYHAACFAAGFKIAPENFVKCMNLATLIAQSESLVECFVESRRMTELVDVLALSSRAIMDVRDKNLRKKLPGHATMDIWKMKAVEGDEEAFRADMVV